jgi:hypothetical protein
MLHASGASMTAVGGYRSVAAVVNAAATALWDEGKDGVLGLCASARWAGRCSAGGRGRDTTRFSTCVQPLANAAAVKPSHAARQGRRGGSP